MSKFIELRKALLDLLKTQHSQVYFQIAPDDAVFPYVVYDLPNSVDDGTLENFVLDIDVWDIDTDTTVLETLISNIDNVLHRKTIYIADTVNAILYRENRMTLADDDKRIRRRKYIYQARTY